MLTAPNRIAESFTIATGANEYADRLFRIIDGVHGVSGRAGLTLQRKHLAQGLEGEFDYYARMVSIDLDAVYPLSSGVHEIGHALEESRLVGSVSASSGRTESSQGLNARSGASFARWGGYDEEANDRGDLCSH